MAKSNMKLAFFGMNEAFNYFRIGGGNSYLRRLSYALFQRVHNLEITWVAYNAKNCGCMKPRERLALYFFPTLEEALAHLHDESYTHVVEVYISPQDRWQFAQFRRQNCHIMFHMLVWSYPSSVLKRYLKFAELLLQPYNGYIFCASPRLWKLACRFTSKAVYLPPPVPEDYFLSLKQKEIGQPLRIAYIGRIDFRKGIDDAVALLSTLSARSAVQCAIRGFYIDSDSDAMIMRKRLLAKRDISYVETQRDQYSDKSEEEMRQVLHDTDVLLLPYRTLDSTVDTPLLLVEAMATLTCVLTRSVGNVASIYGKSPFLIRDANFVKGALHILNSDLESQILTERQRIYRSKDREAFRAESVADKWLHYVEGGYKDHVV